MSLEHSTTKSEKRVADDNIPRTPTNMERSGWVRWGAKAILNLFGWQVTGELPSLSKYVVIAAPHTTNWDFPLMLLGGAYFGVKPYWMVKDTALRWWPIDKMARWLGGIPINRRVRNDIVQQMIDAFDIYDPFVVLIPPEGTRKKTPKWKTGFYHIAVGAGVPILLSFLDFSSKTAGLGPLFYPTGDFEADMKAIGAFYADKKGYHPDQVSPVLPLSEAIK